MITDYLITALSYLKRSEKRGLIRQALRFKGKNGIEVGGPSGVFRLKGQLPVYAFAANVDGVNFSNNTLWENKIDAGNTYRYYKHHTGFQYIGEASEMEFIDTGKYEFLLSCHSLEHVANPLKAVFGWKRVLQKNGLLALVLPDKEYTFDNKRPYTSFEHILNDYNNNTGENDTTHFEEVIELHDFSNDQFVHSKEELAKRTADNITNRAVHHHVFSLALVREMLEYAGFEVTFQQKAKPFHLVTIAKKKD